jgi:hypothetical protein
MDSKLLERVLELALKDGGGGHEFGPLRVGNNVFVRTVTMAYTGTVAAVSASEFLLTEADWIADTGRFADFMRRGVDPSDGRIEVEPFPPGSVLVNRGAVIDISDWPNKLSRSQK